MNSNIDNIIEIFKKLPFEDKIIVQKQISQIINYKPDEKEREKDYNKLYEDLHILAWF